ncbi:MAG: hypothetical protein ABIP75_03620 [Pyrinomonadaceae bacterium]
MLTRTSTQRYLTLGLTVAFLILTAQLILPSVQADDPIGLLTVTGMVKVNGKPAATGDIVASGSGIETVKGSSAVVSLGKLGRVEALPDSKIDLRYTVTGITVVISRGKINVSTGPGVAANVIRKDP